VAESLRPSPDGAKAVRLDVMDGVPHCLQAGSKLLVAYRASRNDPIGLGLDVNISTWCVR
jgi:hypothetical protein